MKTKRHAVVGTGVCFVTMCILAVGLWAPQAHAKDRPRIIFDSDMSSDWDDVGDCAVLHGLASMGECEILGMMVSSQNGGTPLCMDAINTYYGKPDIPIGVRPDIQGVGMYAGQIAAEFPHDLKSAADCPLAVDLYRQLLASSPDQSVIIFTVGYLNNLQALLQSGPDQYSKLSGMDLVREKVRLWTCAGGCFPKGDEFNLRVEPLAAYHVVNNWPAPVVYTGFDIGHSIRTAGRLPEAPTNNPIRRVYVDIQHVYPYPCWGQIAIYHAIRPSEGLWGLQNVGRNYANEQGSNWWSTDEDPVGREDQGYLLERARDVANEGIDAMMMLPPNDGSPSAPGQPSNLRATATGGSRVDLRWTDNAFNEKGFRIERKVNGVFTPVGTVGPNVTSYSVTGLPSTADAAFRVAAFNDVGDSRYARVWVYSGWTEVNFADPGRLPLYTRYRDCDLRYPGSADDHVIINDDSTHGTNVTIDVNTVALGWDGNTHIYFFYQDTDNWYRLSVDRTDCRFEKRIRGTIRQVGPTRPVPPLELQHWQIAVTPSGRLRFTCRMPSVMSGRRAAQTAKTILFAPETLSLSSGKIGLGGWARGLIWEKFRFDASGRNRPDTTPPGIPQGLKATAVSRSQIDLTWSAAPGVTGYDIIRNNEWVAISLATEYSDRALSPDTTYTYQVAAFDAADNISARSSTAGATTRSTAGSIVVTNASFETPVIGGFSHGPADAGWSFADFAGIQHNGSAYGSEQAPDGMQTALLQGTGGKLGSMSQTVTFTKEGRYTVSFYAARRYGGAQPVEVSVDGKDLGIYTPSGNAFELITTAAFTVGAGNHTITFAATDGSSDKTTFIDLVHIDAGSGDDATPPNMP